MRPTLGSNALGFLFENNNAALGDQIRAEVQSLVGRFEPRVQLVDVLVDRTESEVTITLQYVVLATRRRGSVSTTVTTS